MSSLEQLHFRKPQEESIKRGTPLSEINLDIIALIPSGRSVEARATSPECPQSLSNEPNCGGCAWGLLTVEPVLITDTSKYFLAAQYEASCGRNLIVRDSDGRIGAVRKNENSALLFFPGITENFAFKRFVNEAL